MLTTAGRVARHHGKKMNFTFSRASGTLTPLIMLFLILMAVCCSPVWLVKNFVNQDAPSHAYNAFIMTELVRGNSAFAEHFHLNLVPNLTGHFLLALLMLIVTPMVATKIVSTICLFSLTAGIGWLTFVTSDFDGAELGIIAGGTLSMNMMWFMGFYNFILGLAATCVILGLVYRWRSEIGVWRWIILSLLELFVYFSHLLSFAMLLASLGVFVVLSLGRREWRSAIAIVLTLVPIIPTTIWYFANAASHGGFDPDWRGLVPSVAGWLAYMRLADPLSILSSRKMIPFTNISSVFSLLLAPILWVAISAAVLFVSVWRQQRSRAVVRKLWPFVVLAVVFLSAGMFGPDNFGNEHGSIMRQRFALFGIVLLFPVLSVGVRGPLGRLAKACLIVPLLFQTAAVAEYAFAADLEISNYLDASGHVAESESFANIGVRREPPRFSSDPLSNLGGFTGIQKRSIQYSNYEIGYYMFPVVAKDPADADLALALSGFRPLFSTEDRKPPTFEAFNIAISRNHDKISSMIVFGNEPELLDLLKTWYEASPYFSQGDISIFRHRN